ncbi:MAG: UDP-N-acetylmuramate--L-alanine ligase [Clostridiales bacterium]|nr:UDP-N-acetylmuramate--L-alanine ligase [Clostridiales bacterium]
MYTSYSIEKISEIFSQKSRSVYFIGIGGISMSSLAHIAMERGCHVGGYDRTPSDLTRALESCGIEINYTLSPDHIENYDVIVYTAAIKPDNPELARALECDRRGEKYCIYRADFLGWLMSACKNRIGVAGMHGKSTASSMVAQVFLAAELDPTIVLGAELSSIGGAYRIGSRDNFIMEACEYQDSFLSFTPNIAVVLNIDLDHTDYFSGIEQIIESFRKYLAIAADGYAVVNIDDANVRTAIESYTGTIVSYGLESDADFTADNISYDHGHPEFDIIKRGSKLCHVKLAVTGRHNIMNALASAAAADICGVAPEAISRGLASYAGAKRRMELKGSFTTESGASIPLYDDYAHHPTEIRATLSGAKSLGYDRVWVVFQPHTYSRTSSLFDEFAGSFYGVNAIFADIYAAREVNTFGVSSEQLAKAADGVYLPSLDEIAEYLRKTLTDGDMLIVMGAGDIIKLDEILLKK